MERNIKNGFELINKYDIDEVGICLHEYLHIHSGGKVVFLECDDTNCSFAIGFKTLPEDSTGVAHIIEHSLLCGSKKYPLKEPFLNLIKGSMNTFLNAFTASDWTMYPFASQTPKDFDNILSVYLDAVFNPLSVENPNAFYQEGWHLEMFSKEDIPSYKGVVYNEMKGAMSSVEEQLIAEIQKRIYKDSPYGYNSGGDPKDIPNLTFAQYCDFYKKHYRPENALAIFYGNLDIEAKLKYLDEEYYSHFEKTGEEIVCEVPSPFIDEHYTKEYAIGEGEGEENNTYIGLSYALDKYENQEEYIAFQILQSALFSTNASPLKKALLDSKLAIDFSTVINDVVLPSFSILAYKANGDVKDKFEKVFLDEVRKLVDQGIEKDLLLSSINYYEFKEKEMDVGRTPKGIIYSMNLMTAFNYGVSYRDALEVNGIFDKLKELYKGRYFEELLEKYFLNSKHHVAVSLIPSATLAKKEEADMNALMHDIKAKMSDKEIEDLIALNENLKAYQNKVDTKEELKTFPKLSLRDIPCDVNFLKPNMLKINGIKGLKYVVNTNSIAYLSMYFDLCAVKYEDLPYVHLLCNLIGKVKTTHLDEKDINIYIKKYLGGISFSPYIAPIDKDNAKVYLKVSVSALNSSIEKIPYIMNELLFHSKYTTDKIETKIAQNLNYLRSAIIENGTTFASEMALASYSKEHAIKLKVSPSVELYEFLKDLANTDMKEIKNKLNEINALIFTKKNAFLSLGGNQECIDKLSSCIKEIKLPRKENKEQLEVVLRDVKKTAYVIPSGVSYNVIANNICDLGAQFNGSYFVLNHIISSDYLWNEVRVKGGAYGTGLRITSTGNIAFTSYRDPSVQGTFNKYFGVVDYLNNLKLSKDEYKNFLIGAVGSYDLPGTIQASIRSADYAYFIGFTKKMKIQHKKEMLKTKVEDIIALSSLLEKVLETGSRYTIGNETKIKATPVFDEIKYLK